MTRYAITATPDVNPDCTTPDTGEPKGLDGNGYLYWEWTNEAGTWQLKWDLTPEAYLISLNGSGPAGTNPYWSKAGNPEEPAGEYAPTSYTSGTVTVAEYVPPAGGCGPPRALFDW